MKLDRLLSIVIMLLNKERIPAKELADTFEVSVRTIYRDIDAISEAGIPVVSYPGNTGGFGIMENFKLDRQIFGVKDMLAVLTALKGIQEALTDSSLDGAIDKIGSMMPTLEETEEQFVIDFVPWGYQDKQRKLLKRVSQAVNNRKLLAFHYKNSKGEHVERTIEPMTLIFKGYAWYIFGFCRLRKDFRIFRLSRMSDVTIGEKGFIRRKGRWQEYFSGVQPVQELIDINLRFSPKLQYRVEDYFGEESIAERDDGSSDVSISLPCDDWIYSFLLSFGEGVEVISPDWLRTNLIEKCKKICSVYSKPDTQLSQD